MRAINSEAMCYSLLLHENLLGSFRFIELLETICIMLLQVSYLATLIVIYQVVIIDTCIALLRLCSEF